MAGGTQFTEKDTYKGQASPLAFTPDPESVQQTGLSLSRTQKLGSGAGPSSRGRKGGTLRVWVLLAPSLTLRKCVHSHTSYHHRFPKCSVQMQDGFKFKNNLKINIYIFLNVNFMNVIVTMWLKRLK